MYLIVNPSGSILGWAVTPEDAWTKVYDDNLGGFVVPIDRVTVNVDLGPMPNAYLYVEEYDILKEVFARSSTPTPAIPSQDSFEEWYSATVLPYVHAGNKIDAIKAVRAFTSLGLGEAKHVMDRIWTEIPY